MTLTYYEQIAHKTGVTLNPMQRYARQAEGFDRTPARFDEDQPSNDFYDNGQKRRRTKVFDPATGRRICSECLLPKEPTAYSKNRNAVDGRDARCRECKSELARLRHLRSQS